MMNIQTAKMIFLALIVALVCAAGVSAVETVPAMVTVVTGESRILATTDVNRVAIGDEKIADIIVVSPSELIVNGKQPGVTSLHVWEKTGRREYLVKVYVDNSTLGAEITDAISDPRISVRVLRQTVFLEGQVDTAFASTRAQKIAEAYEERVVNLLQITVTEVVSTEEPVEVSKVTDDELLEQSSGPDLAQIALDLTGYLQNENLQARVYGRGVLVEGNVGSEAEATRVKAVAEFYAKQAGCDITVVTTVVPRRGPKIALQVHVVELSTDVMESIGLTWGSMYNGGVLPYELMFSQLNLDSPIQRISPVAAKLDMLVQDGGARILAAPSLVTNSGEQADFLAGGEIPVPIPADGKLSIEWKEYGVKLSMLPVIDKDNRITLQVLPEVSSLDVANAIKLDGWVVPALKTRRTKTQVDLQAGETLIIGGLISNEQTKMVQKLPILGDIPILGNLFRSTEFKDGQTQLLIMVTPEIISDEHLPGLDFHLQNELQGEIEALFPEIANPLVPKTQKRSETDGSLQD